VRYDMSYMFIYSEREGTPAAIHFDDIDRRVKVERLTRLIELSKEISSQQGAKWIGREVEVLIKGRAAEEGFVQGHTRGNHVALVKANLAPGMHKVKVAQATPNRLYCTTDASALISDHELTQLPAEIYQLSFAV